MTARELALRARILRAFADTGEAPEVEDSAALRALEREHVVVLDPRAPRRIVMAHPFAAQGSGARVTAGERTWWGNCAWDGLGIVAALGLHDASVRSGGVEVRVRGAAAEGDAVFHVAVPARDWWEDIAFT